MWKPRKNDYKNMWKLDISYIYLFYLFIVFISYIYKRN